MKSKTVKCRVSHFCDCCNEKIDAGQFAIFQKWRSGWYDEDDEQIGILYLKSYVHADHDNVNDCPQCNHRTGYKETRSHTQAHSAKYECSNCGYQTTFP